MRRVYCLLILLYCLSLASTTAKAQEGGVSLELRVGFDGFYKTNSWVPVWVTLTNEGPDLAAKLQVEDSQQSGWGNIQYMYPVDLPSQSRKQFVLYVPLGGDQNVRVTLVDQKGKTLISDDRNVEPLTFDDLLVGVIASDPSLLNALAGLKTTTGYRVAVAHLKSEDLPVILQPWVSLDILVLNDTDTSLFTPAQQEALNSWIGAGGRLIVGGGPNAPQTIAGLSSLLPFSETEFHTLAHPLTSLQQLVRQPIPDRGPYIAAVPAQVSADRFLAQEGDLPLISLWEHGAGQICYLALDLGLAPLDLLATQETFFPLLVQNFQVQRIYEANGINYSEMRTSLTYIPNSPLPTPLAITLYLIFYIVLVGPANYFFLRYVKRRDWAWFTIPLVVFLFSGAGYLCGFQMRGTRPLVRQITLVRANMPQNTPLAEVSSFIGVFSPSRTSYTLALDQAPLIATLPDYYSSGYDLTVTAREPLMVENLATDIGGMSTIVARTQMPAPQISAKLSYNSQSRHIQGSINNGTDRPIDDAYLVIGNEALELGPLPVGESSVRGYTSPLSYSNFYSQPGSSPTSEEAVLLASHDKAVQAILNTNIYQPNTLPAPQLYLVGWQEGSPTTVDLLDYSFDRQDETLLLVTLPFD